MKRTTPDTEVTPSPRDFKKLKLDLALVKEKADQATAEAQRLQAERNALEEELDQHPETLAEEAAAELEELRLHMPATLYRILVEEGDEKHGKLTRFQTDARWSGDRRDLEIQVEMTFSKSGRHLFTMEDCDMRGNAEIEGVNVPVLPRSLSRLWQSALSINHSVPRALAALAVAGREKKIREANENLLEGLVSMLDE